MALYVYLMSITIMGDTHTRVFYDRQTAEKAARQYMDASGIAWKVNGLKGWVGEWRTMGEKVEINIVIQKVEGEPAKGPE